MKYLWILFLPILCSEVARAEPETLAHGYAIAPGNRCENGFAAAGVACPGDEKPKWYNFGGRSQGCILRCSGEGAADEPKKLEPAREPRRDCSSQADCLEADRENRKLLEERKELGEEKGR